MTITLPQTCGLCACRQKDGRCHRYPPSINHPNKDLSAWPIVADNAAGCFEFRPLHVLAVPEVQEAVKKNVEWNVREGGAHLNQQAEQVRMIGKEPAKVGKTAKKG